eukprot:COSAG01_NODE_44427_length_419_cov_1.093750_1_plen_50_part_01
MLSLSLGCHGQRKRILPNDSVIAHKATRFSLMSMVIIKKQIAVASTECAR